MKTLKKLTEEYSANGAWLDDAGNGCGGECWIKLEDLSDEQLNLEMQPPSEKTEQSFEYDYVSDWQYDDITDPSSYRYRLFF